MRTIKPQWFIFYFSLALIFVLSCNKKEKQITKLTFHIHYAYGYKIYLETVPFTGEKTQIIDSATVKNGDDRIIFRIPKTEERPYIVKIKGTDLRIMFIDDRPEIAIEANILHTEEYEVKGSPATTALKAFMEEQANLMEENRKKSAIIDSLKTRKFSLHITDSLQKEVNRDLVDFFQRYIKFADTISSPAAFLYIYNNVDFGRDYSGLKKFILHAAERFPSAPQVQKLKTETLEYLKAFGKQYNPGDQLPDVELPNVNGNIFSTSLLRGKYVFMDFWSTWCEDCLKYDAEKQRAKKEFSPDKFEIVSIALDAEKDTWKSYIEARKLDWPELIDEKMWEGPTARNLRVDSLPFNYLLAPDGKIIYKAVKPDSLLPILKKIIR